METASRASFASMSDPNRQALTLAEILADPAMTSELLDIGKNRLIVSADYMKEYHDKWLRFNKMYRNIVDSIDDDDEPNTGVVYAYAIIEDLVSKISEPLLQLRPPCRPAARRAGDEKSAERFEHMAGTYFRTAKYQIDYTNSTREMCITGNAWEKDCWFNDYETGRIWAKIKKVTETLVRNLFGLVTGKEPVEYTDIQEVAHQEPIRVGYGCEFPSIFRVFPEPHVNSMDAMHWLNEEVPSAAIVDLEKRMVRDPRTGQMVRFFNFDALRGDSRRRTGTIAPEPMSRERSTAEDELRSAVGDEPESDKAQTYADDVDRVSLLWCWEKNRVWVIANGAYIVAYQENLFHKPRIPYRLKCYTPQKDFLFGTGAIEPVESQLLELNDIHKLSMRNWVRIVNRMLAYEEGTVPFEDDFTPSALGRIRVRPKRGRSVAESIVPIHHDDVTGTMLNQESNIKGIVEHALSVADFSPGTQGTKQTHKTLGGLMEISRSMAVRVQTVRRMRLADYQQQMFVMEQFYSQFLMEKMPFTVYGPDGTTAIMEWDLWDIYTAGRGFDFIIEYDPSFGDDQIRRNQLMAFLQLQFQYLSQSKLMGLRDVAQPNVEETMRQLSRSFGWYDTSRILPKPNGIMDPDDELKEMVAGRPVKPNPLENMLDHLANHTAQELMLAPIVQQGNVPPEAMLMLKAHKMATAQMIAQMLQNPGPAAQSIIAEKMQLGVVPGMAPPGVMPGGAPMPQSQLMPKQDGAAAGAAGVGMEG